MVDAVAMEENLYILKAIQFIISIHIPIILRCLFRWHWMGLSIYFRQFIIFLELVMGPTCSVCMKMSQWKEEYDTETKAFYKHFFLVGRNCQQSIIQGLVITLGTLSVYQFWFIRALMNTLHEQWFSGFSNIKCIFNLNKQVVLLFHFTTLRYKNNLVFIVW
jgi:Ca2+-transporting ATPase